MSLKKTKPKTSEVEYLEVREELKVNVV